MNNFSLEDLNLAVKRGVSWLDENHEGWENRIDLDKLEMGSCQSCVIGQAVGDYFRVVDREGGGVGDGDEWSEAHGFQSPPFNDQNGIRRRSHLFQLLRQSR